MRARALVVEDDADGGGVLRPAIAAEGFVVHAVTSADAAIDALFEIDPPLVVVDWHVQGRGRVPEVLRVLAARHPATVVVVVSHALRDVSVRHAISTAHAGALMHDREAEPDTLRLRIRGTVGRPFGDLVVRNGVVVHIPCDGCFRHAVGAQLVAGRGRPVLVLRMTAAANAAWRFQKFLELHGSPLRVAADHSGHRHLVDTGTLSGCAASRSGSLE